MPVEISGQNSKVTLLAQQKIGIVVSRYNDAITRKLSEAALKTLIDSGIPSQNILVVHVPGAWEIPFAVQRLVDDSNVVGVVTLGAVIRGETTHDVHINRSVSTALMQLSIDHNKPIAFGLLTVNSLEQAIQRSGGNKGNKGEECAEAILECLSLGSRLNELKRNHGKTS
jgi:6,7-dimethyl-8-ribityllumazine synthase